MRYLKRSRRESNRRHMELQSIALPTELPSLIAGAGFEPTTFGLCARRATELLHPALIKKEDVGFEPTHAVTRLTVFKTVPFSRTWVILQNSPYGIRTRVTAVKRRCLNPLTNGPNFMGTSGLEPPTSRLSGVRSNHLSYAPKLKTW